MAKKINEKPEEVLSFNDDDVEVLEALEGVRKRFDMYAGSNPVFHMLKEAIDNSIDEFMNNFGDSILIKIDTKENRYTIRDFGRGIPLGMNKKLNLPTLEVLVSKTHSGGKFSHKTLKTSGGKNGIGIKIISACSEIAEYKSIRLREGTDKYAKATIAFSKGKKIKDFEVKNIKTKPSTHSGFEISFIPDQKLFESRLGKGSHIIDIDTLCKELELKAYINKGLKIILKIDDKEEKVFYSKNGLIDYINNINKTPFSNMEAFSFSGKGENSNYEIAFSFNNDKEENIISFVNSIPTSSGTHETGFRQGFTKAFNDYIKTNNLLSKKDSSLKIDGTDIRRGLCAIIVVKHNDPIYTGQTKDELGNKEVRGIISNITYENITKFLIENSKLAKELCLRIIAFAKATLNSKEQIKKIIKVSQNNLGLQISEKFLDCELNDPEVVEIYCVEGDSASGSVETGRFPAYQCVFPLKGKIKNTKGSSVSTIISNSELNEFLLIEFGTNNLKEIREILQSIIADPSKGNLIKSHRIIILCDADEDGKHIIILFLNFIYEHLPEMIELGYIYIGVSPFYRVLVNKKWRYFTDKKEYNKFTSEVIEEQYSLKTDSKEKWTVDRFLENSERFLMLFNKIKDENSIHSDIMNIIFREDDYNDIVDYIVFEFSLSIDEAGNVEGLYNNQWNSFNLNEVIEEIDSELSSIYQDLKYVTLLDKKTNKEEDYDIYDAINILKKAFKYKRNRIKGLGELDGKELQETTLDPKNRILIQAKSNEDMTEEENELFNVLFGGNADLRKTFIKKSMFNS